MYSVANRLKNVSLITLRNGKVRLYDDLGNPIDSFTKYFEYLDSEYPPNTRNRYLSAVAHFLDYLIEAGVLNSEIPPKESVLSKVIKEYPKLLNHAVNSEDTFTAEIAKRMKRKPVKNIGNTISAINLFLRLSTTWASEARELLEYEFGITFTSNQKLFSSLDSVSRLSRMEITRLRQYSVLGANLRHISSGAGKRSDNKPGLPNNQRVTTPAFDKTKAFDVRYIKRLLLKTNNKRDRVFYALCAACGLRESEALFLPLELVDLGNQTIRIEDPENKRGTNQYLPNELTPYKGRATAKVYIIGGLKNILFEAINDYLMVRPSTDNPYLLVKMTDAEWGRPFFETNNHDRNKSFKRVQRKIGINEEKLLSLHSLRHFYGVYLRNYVVLPNRAKPGLELDEIQTLMGHADIRATRQYAKVDDDILYSELEAADLMLEGRMDISDLPRFIANRYRELADAIEGYREGASR